MGTPAPGSGQALTLSGDPAIAAVDGDVPLASLAAGGHTILIEAQDDLGHWGATASIHLVIDLAGPTVTSVAVSPNPNNGTLSQDGYPGVVWVTATVTDAGPNVSPIKAAEGYIDAAGTPAGGTGWTMLAVDGVFDQPVEQVYAQIPLSEIAKLSDGSHVFSVRGLDVAGNWGALATGTLQIDKSGPTFSVATLTPASANRGQSVRLNATAADGSGVDRFEYFLDAGNATAVSVTLGSPRSIVNPPSTGRQITIPNSTRGTVHFVYVRARDGAGNWSPWNQIQLTVPNGLLPLSLPVDLGPVVGVTPLTAPVISTKPIVRILVRAVGQARLVSVVSTHPGSVRARFVFAPRGMSFRGTRTILNGKDTAGHIVLRVLVRGNAKHGYHLRAVSGSKKSAWLSLNNHRVVLETAMHPGGRPSLIRAH